MGEGSGGFGAWHSHEGKEERVDGQGKRGGEGIDGLMSSIVVCLSLSLAWFGHGGVGRMERERKGKSN